MNFYGGTIGGSSANTYTGATTFIGANSVTLAKTSGYAVTGDFTIANQYLGVYVEGTNAQFPASANVTFSGGGEPRIEVCGNTVTVGSISSSGSTPSAIVENCRSVPPTARLSLAALHPRPITASFAT